MLSCCGQHRRCHPIEHSTHDCKVFSSRLLRTWLAWLATCDAEIAALMAASASEASEEDPASHAVVQDTERLYSPVLLELLGQLRGP